MRTLAPIVFFAYDRPDHTRQALESLYRNKLADESSLWIYIDGPKPGATDASKSAIEEVKKVVREKKWCKEVFITEAEINKGLIRANIEGITKAVNEYGKVIAMEDDGLVSPGFLMYMNDALDFYENNSRVMHVSGYSRPEFDTVDMKETTYFFYHTTTWGWGTWKRAWDKFIFDPIAIREAIKKKGNIHKLNMDHTFEFFWGLKAVAQEKFQSWNTLWHSIVFLNDGLCLYPRRSLVSNIGHDGSGTNCVLDDRFRIDGLADEIEVTQIPLIEHPGVRSSYVKLYSLRYRIIFKLKHYLKFLMR